MGTQILIPTDGTERAAKRIERAFERARNQDATVHALYVVDTRRYGEPALSSTEVLIDCFEDEGRGHLQALVEEGERREVSVIPHCRHGDPAEEIAAAAEESDVDAVIPTLVDVTSKRLRRLGVDPHLLPEGDTAPTA